MRKVLLGRFSVDVMRLLILICELWLKMMLCGLIRKIWLLDCRWLRMSEGLLLMMWLSSIELMLGCLMCRFFLVLMEKFC